MKKVALVALVLAVLMACGPTYAQKSMVGKTLTVQQGSFEIKATITGVDQNLPNILFFGEAIVYYPADWQDVRIDRGDFGAYSVTVKLGNALRTENISLRNLSSLNDQSKNPGPDVWLISPDNNFAIEWRNKEAR